MSLRNLDQIVVCDHFQTQLLILPQVIILQRTFYAQTCYYCWFPAFCLFTRSIVRAGIYVEWRSLHYGLGAYLMFYGSPTYDPCHTWMTWLDIAGGNCYHLHPLPPYLVFQIHLHLSIKCVQPPEYRSQTSSREGSVKMSKGSTGIQSWITGVTQGQSMKPQVWIPQIWKSICWL